MALTPRRGLFARRGPVSAQAASDWKKAPPEGPDPAIVMGRKRGITRWIADKNTNHPFRTWAKTTQVFTQGRRIG